VKHGKLERVLDVCRSAAHDAGALVLRGFRHKMVIEHKSSVEVVTKFDRESETLLRCRLSKGLNFPIVGEELGGRLTEEAVLYVDPIDGTTNFVHGHPFWCVSIGLVSQGVPILGVVVAPALSIEWYGVCASDAPPVAKRVASSAQQHTRNMQESSASAVITEGPCIVSPTARFEDSLLATGFPYDRATSPDNNFDTFVAIKRRCQAVRRCGSAAIDLCLVADGTYEGYWERKLRPWDIAGGSAIVRASGGQVSDFDGGGDYITTGHIVATNGAIHNKLLRELAMSRPKSGPKSG